MEIRKGEHGLEKMMRVLRGMAREGDSPLGKGQMTAVMRVGEDSRKMEIRKGWHGPKDIIKSMRVLGGVALEERSLLGKGLMTAVMRVGDDSSWESI